MRGMLVFFGMCLLLGRLDSQVIRMADVLATAPADKNALKYQSLRDMTSGVKMQDPWIRELALRIGFNGSVLGDTIYGYLRNEDDIRLQVGFNSLAERRRQAGVKSARIGTLSAMYALSAHEALALRYDALARFMYGRIELEALQRLDSLLNREQDILREMLATGILEVKVNRVLSVEEDRNDALLDIREKEDQLALARQKLQDFTGGFTDISREGLATVDDLRAFFLDIAAEGPGNHPSLLFRSAQVRLDSALWQYTSGRNRQVLDYVSLGYQRPLYLDRPKNFNPFNNFAFRVGLLVPLSASNRYRTANASIDLWERQTRADADRLALEQAWREQSERVLHLIDAYALAQERLDNSMIRQMLDSPDLRTHLTPLEYIELEIAQQKMFVRQAELRYALAIAYTRWLALSDRPTREIGINFLARRQ